MAYYDKEQIEKANSFNLVDLLRSSGHILVPERSRGEYHLQEHDSLKISEYKNRWHWFSRDTGGKNIDFFMQYEGLSFVDAVDRIYALSGNVAHGVAAEAEKAKPAAAHIADTEHREPYKMPERNKDDRRAYAYLVKTRGLDPKLVSRLLKSGHVYESEKRHNVVFVGTDYKGNVTSSFERGTGEKRFAGDTAGSDKRYRFRIVSPGSQKVNVFEAEIDMLSYISMNGLKKENYIALGGVSTLALDAFIKESGICIDHINLCLDNDEAGNTHAKQIADEMKDYIVTREVPKYKDFNEDLKAMRSLEVDKDLNA